MVSSPPLVSIIIPTYKRAEVENAVQSALDQTYDNLEIIVIDDSGEEFARPLLTGYPEVDLHCLEVNRGANVARRHGFEKSSGEYVQFLDDDDRIAESKIERGVDRFLSNSSLSVVYTGVEFREQEFHPDLRGAVLEEALKFDMWPCMTSSMLINRSAIEAANVFQDIPGADDLQMMIELAQQGEFDFVDEILVTKGDPPNSKGGSESAFRGRFDILEMYNQLYQQYPESVYGSARGEAEFHEAKYHLGASIWSLTAVCSMARHCYWTPSEGSSCLFKILASMFGRPGWKFANWAYDNARGAE